MNNDIKTRAYPIIAAFLFLTQILYQLISKIRYRYLFFYDIDISDIIFYVITLAFAIVLFIGKKNISLIVVSCTKILYSTYYLIRYFSLYNALSFLTYVSLTLIIILGIKNTDIVKKIFFIPAVVSLVNSMVDFISLILNGLIVYISNPFLSILLAVAGALPLFFIGLWVSKPAVSNSMITTTNQLNTLLIGGADKIKAYKELLDAGVITQEEFEEKKKQILNS